MLAALLGGVFLWAYALPLKGMVESWSYFPQYSHGFLVPVFALFLLYSRADLFRQSRWQPSLLGLPIFLAGLGLWYYGALTFREYWINLSLPITLAGTVWFVGGTSIIRWSWPAIGFLCFMLPLPFRIEEIFSHTLRNYATVGSTYLLQTLGYPALSEGNVIFLDNIRLGVADACSGLGMLMTFFALSTAMAFLVEPYWQKAVLVLSAVPIALGANILRITLTCIAHVHFGKELAQHVLHDWAGFLMMPMALGILLLEMKFMKHLIYEVGKPLPVLMTGERPLHAREN